MEATALLTLRRKVSLECREGDDRDSPRPNGRTPARAQTLKHRWKKTEGRKAAGRAGVKACFAQREKNKVLCDRAGDALDLRRY